MPANPLILLVISAHAADVTKEIAIGDSLYREGNYGAAADSFARARQARPWDDTLVLKQFLACEFADRDCGQNARVDAYYAERSASPFTALMMDYRRDRITLMRKRRYRFSGLDWLAFHAGKALSEREFYALVGEPGLSRHAARRQRASWVLGASGSAMALTAAAIWIFRPGRCGHEGGTAECRAVAAGTPILGILGFGTALAGFALGRENLITMDSARALAQRRNLSDLRKRTAHLDLFPAAQGRDTPAGAGGEAEP